VGGPFTSLEYNRVESATRGYFVQPQVGLWDAVYLTYGLRVENNDNYGPEYGVNYAPRYGVSVVQSVGGLTAKVRAAYGRATEPPEVYTREDEFETSTLYGITYRSRVGNRRIRPEFQRGTEVGADLEYRTWGSLQVTRFDQTADDLIADLQLPPDTVVVEGFDEPLITSSYTAINVGRVRTRGWEAQARAQAGPVVLTGTFSTTDGRVLRVNEEAQSLYRVGDRIRGPARRSGALDASYSAGRLATGVRLSYIGPVFLNRSIALDREIQFGRVPRLASRLFRVLPPEFTGYEQSGYRTVDLHAAYDVTQSANLFVRVYNAGNYFRNDFDDFQAAPGRRVLAGARLRY
jgi:outer membrane receptor for ferrienterochelin and colicin